MTFVADIPDEGGILELVRGDSYLNADGSAFFFTESDSNKWSDLSVGGTTISIKLGTLVKVGTIVTSGASVTQQVRFDLTAAETTALLDSAYTYQVYATFASGARHTLITGKAIIKGF